MNAFVSINKGFGGAEKQFDQFVDDLREIEIFKNDWKYIRKDLNVKNWFDILYSLFRQRSGLVVFNMSVLGIGIFPLFILRLLGNKIILYPHVVVSPRKSRPRMWVLRLIQQWLSTKLADKIVAISDGNYFTLERFVKPEKIVVVYNYVSCENGREFSNIKYNKDIAIIGRLQNNHKRQLDFLRLNYNFILEHNLKIHLFGSGPDHLLISELINEKKLNSNIVLHGWCDESAIYSNLFGFVLNLSRWEGLPLSILEAIYRDRIVLLSDIDGNRELAYGDFLFKSNFELQQLILDKVVNGNYSRTLLSSQKKRLFLRCNKARSLLCFNDAVGAYVQ